MTDEVIAASPTWNVPTFDGVSDALNIFNGFVLGSVNVLPANNMIQYCYSNGTLLYPKAIDVYT